MVFAPFLFVGVMDMRYPTHLELHYDVLYSTTSRKQYELLISFDRRVQIYLYYNIVTSGSKKRGGALL
jgi:hypothetical protein